MKLTNYKFGAVGITFGAFDLLHAGHIAMLANAKDVCGHLIVGLQTDPTIDRLNKNKPVQSLIERYIQLEAVKYVDQIIVYQTEKDLIDILYLYPIDIRIVGEDYLDKDFTGKEDCSKLGIKICYNNRKHNFSSSELRKRIVESTER